MRETKIDYLLNGLYFVLEITVQNNIYQANLASPGTLTDI